ncbi:MAG: hypothetical protein V7641_37 [Blastocatellia bacterium]
MTIKRRIEIKTHTHQVVRINRRNTVIKGRCATCGQNDGAAISTQPRSNPKGGFDCAAIKAERSTSVEDAPENQATVKPGNIGNEPSSI